MQPAFSLTFLIHYFLQIGGLFFTFPVSIPTGCSERETIAWILSHVLIQYKIGITIETWWFDLIRRDAMIFPNISFVVIHHQRLWLICKLHKYFSRLTVFCILQKLADWSFAKGILLPLFSSSLLPPWLLLSPYLGNLANQPHSRYNQLISVAPIWVYDCLKQLPSRQFFLLISSNGIVFSSIQSRHPNGIKSFMKSLSKQPEAARVVRELSYLPRPCWCNISHPFMGKPDSKLNIITSCSESAGAILF